MADINNELNQIKNAVYGREVRGSIHDGIDKINKETESTTDLVEETEQRQANLEQQFTDVIENDSVPNPSNIETVAARTNTNTNKSYDTLGKRLDAEQIETQDSLNSIDQQLAHIVDVENYELNSKFRRKRGIGVFTSDDAREEEFTVAKDIFEPEGVPQTVYLISDQINKPGYLTQAQCLELQELGWEMASHSKTHPAPFPSISDEQAEMEFRDSKVELQNMGLEVRNYSYVGGNYGRRERRLARKYYRSARCSDRNNDGVNLSPLNTYEMKTIWIDPETNPLRDWLAEDGENLALNKMDYFVKSAIDKAHEQNGLLVISTHFVNINTPALKAFYSSMVQYAKSKLDVTTMNDALNKVGNIIDIGDYSQYGRHAANEGHFVVGSDGLMTGSLSVTDIDRFSPRSKYTDFPFGVTVVPFSRSNSTGGPEENTPGLLINIRTRDEDNNFNFQKVISYSHLATYTRRVDSSLNFLEWEASPELIKSELFNPTTSPSKFPSGVSTVDVTSLSEGLSDTPNGKAGNLITIKPKTLGSGLNYVYQDFLETGTSLLYRRLANSNDSWNGWVLLDLYHLPEFNDFNPSTPIKDFKVGTTYSIVTSASVGISDAPDGERGRLITHKLTDSSQISYSYQEYITIDNKSYIRNPSDLNNWREWRFNGVPISDL